MILPDRRSNPFRDKVLYNSSESLEVGPQPKADVSRWKQIEAIYAGALALPPPARAAFVDHSCAGDSDLRCEVESLLKASEQAVSFLTPAQLGIHINELSPEDGTMLAGRSLGHYEIVSRIGGGANGDVYLAFDRALAARGATLGERPVFPGV